MQPALAARVALALGGSGWKLEVDPDMPDGQCLLLAYPSAFENEAGYINPVVKIELGARSDDWPHEDRPIQPYLAERFPQLMPEARFLSASLPPTAPSGKRPACSTRKPSAPLTSRESSAWPAITTISVCGEQRGAA